MRRWLAVSALLFCACAAPHAPAAKAPAALVEPPLTATLDYGFRLDPARTRLEVTLCSSGDLPKHLVYGSRPAVLYVRDPRLVSEGGLRLPVPRPLPLANDLIQLGNPRGPACVAYDVDIAGALADGRLLLACAASDVVVTSTELFLWRPPRRAANLRVRAHFELAEGQRVSVPWPERDGAYVLDERAFSFTGHAMFGRFERQRVSVPAASLQLDTPAGFSAERLGWIATWLQNAGEVVSLATGSFPAPELQVIVLPTASFAFRFGHTGRSGGGSILLFMPADVTLDSLRDDWIAIHEFSHLLHPFVRREDAWLSEGIATYLQEVLRVRAGMLKAEAAWQRMYEGAALGRDAPGDLASETLRMAYAPNYQTVYWAGAAIALMADVELRRRTQGHESLDTALAALADQREFMAAPATAQSLLDALDRASGQTAFHDIAARYLKGDELPDLSELYGELGVRGAEAHAPLAWIRDAIMAPRRARSDLPLFAH